MLFSFTLGGTRFTASPTTPAHTLCQPVVPTVGALPAPSAFHLPPASAFPVCAVDGGAGVNCDTLTLNAHANGTHTECIGHVLSGGRPTIFTVSPPPLLPAVLLTVQLTQLANVVGEGDAYPPGAPDDWVISLSAVVAAFAGVASGTPSAPHLLSTGGLVLRTPGGAGSKLGRSWSGTNPPYPTPAAVGWAVQHGVHHLVLDLPSTDRESDGGEMRSHRAFWGLPPRGLTGSGGREHCTITELAGVESDAAPSRPQLIQVCREGEGV